MAVERSDLEYGPCLEFVPENLKTEKLCSAAVAADPTNLAFVPDTLITETMCWDAVARDPSALEFVPDEMLTVDLMDMVPQEIRTKVMGEAGTVCTLLPQ